MNRQALLPPVCCVARQRHCPHQENEVKVPSGSGAPCAPQACRQSLGTQGQPQAGVEPAGCFLRQPYQERPAWKQLAATGPWLWMSNEGRCTCPPELCCWNHQLRPCRRNVAPDPVLKRGLLAGSSSSGLGSWRKTLPQWCGTCLSAGWGTGQAPAASTAPQEDRDRDPGTVYS